MGAGTHEREKGVFKRQKQKQTKTTETILLVTPPNRVLQVQKLIMCMCEVERRWWWWLEVGWGCVPAVYYR